MKPKPIAVVGDYKLFGELVKLIGGIFRNSTQTLILSHGLEFIFFRDSKSSRRKLMAHQFQEVIVLGYVSKELLELLSTRIR